MNKGYIIYLTAATGAKNQRYVSRIDEDVYLYCAHVQRKNKLTFSNYTFSNVKTETKQTHPWMFQKRKHTMKVMI